MIIIIISKQIIVKRCGGRGRVAGVGEGGGGGGGSTGKIRKKNEHSLGYTREG